MKDEHLSSTKFFSWKSLYFLRWKLKTSYKWSIFKTTKLRKLTKRLKNPEQMLKKAQSFNLIVASANKLQKMKLDNLKQYLWRSFFLITGVDLPPKKTIETAENSAKSWCNYWSKIRWKQGRIWLWVTKSTEIFW